MFQYNLKKSPNDNRDYIISIDGKQQIPNFYDLSVYCTQVKNQGNIGSCSAHASIASLELLCKKYLKDNKNKFENPEDIFSEKFLYYVTRVNIEGSKENEDTGVFLRNTVKALTKYGVCLEKSFPYNSKFYEKPSEQNYKEALDYQTTRYARIVETSPNLIEEIKNVIYNGNSVICGINCYDNIFQEKKGIIPMNNIKNKCIGGHAILIVGYDDRSRIFKFKNSWGSDWGDNGFGYLFYDYLSNNLLECWVIYDTEINNMNLSSFIEKNKKLNDIIEFILQNITKISISEIRDKIENEDFDNRQKQILFSFLSKINSSYNITINILGLK